METLLDNPQPQVPLNHVVRLELPEIVECCLCHGLLWHPVACANCEIAVCSTCIRALNANRSEPICPHGCSSYIERTCPKSTCRVLSILNIFCRYQPNGCSEIPSYDELEGHEEQCDYQLSTCLGCQQEIIKKNVQEHNNECGLIVITCEQCLTSFQRKDTGLHTPAECLRIQLHQQISKIKQLEIKESEQQTKINSMEQKLKEYESFWMGFFKTTKQIRSMFDEQVEPVETPGHSEELSV